MKTSKELQAYNQTMLNLAAKVHSNIVSHCLDEDRAVYNMHKDIFWLVCRETNLSALEYTKKHAEELEGTFTVQPVFGGKATKVTVFPFDYSTRKDASCNTLLYRQHQGELLAGAITALLETGYEQA